MIWEPRSKPGLATTGQPVPASSMHWLHGSKSNPKRPKRSSQKAAVPMVVQLEIRINRKLKTEKDDDLTRKRFFLNEDKDSLKPFFDGSKS
jgi:hypothetical protein